MILVGDNTNRDEGFMFYGQTGTVRPGVSMILVGDTTNRDEGFIVGTACPTKPYLLCGSCLSYTF